MAPHRGEIKARAQGSGPDCNTGLACENRSVGPRRGAVNRLPEPDASALADLVTLDLNVRGRRRLSRRRPCRLSQILAGLTAPVPSE